MFLHFCLFYLKLSFLGTFLRSFGSLPLLLRLLHDDTVSTAGSTWAAVFSTWVFSTWCWAFLLSVCSLLVAVLLLREPCVLCVWPLQVQWNTLPFLCYPWSHRSNSASYRWRWGAGILGRLSLTASPRHSRHQLSLWDPLQVSVWDLRRRFLCSQVPWFTV